MKIQEASEQLSLFLAADDSLQPQPIAPQPPGTAFDWADDDAAVLPRHPERHAGGIDNSHTVASSMAQPSTGSIEEPAEEDECDWSAFLREHGRVPMLGDKKKPWQYRGWLMYYRLLLEAHPGVGQRWEYWCRTMSAGRLLREPIPQIHFCESGDKGVFKDIDRWVRSLDHSLHGWSAVGGLVDWLLWGFGFSNEPPVFPNELNELLYRQINIGPMLVTPHDYIGEWIAMQKGNWNPHAFYPTPHSVVECMVRMTMDQDQDLSSSTVCDPCVGSGRMLLHASNYSLRLYGADIDPTLVKVTYLNGALYPPWILRPFPETFFAEPRRRPLRGEMLNGTTP